MANPVQVTENKTRVLDPGVDSGPLVVVYRGLGPEFGKAYAYDTADWMIGQIQKAIPKESLNKIVFAVPDDYNQDCEKCIQQDFQARAVDERYVVHVQHNLLLSFRHHALDLFPERVAFFPQHDSPVQRDHGYAVHFS
jgi:hypothetical protein